MTSAIILAGGLGTRLRDAVPDLPKPMAPVAGRPFLAHQMDHWIGQGIDHFVLSVGYRAVAISNHFGDRYRGVPIDYAVEPRRSAPAARWFTPRPGCARASRRCCSTATPTSTSRSRRSPSTRHSLDADWCLALFRHDDAARYMGVALSPEGRITALRERSAPLANGGVYWFRPEALAAAPLAPGQAASLEDDLLPRLLARGQRLAGLVAAGDFIDIGVPHDYQRAAAVLPRAERSRSIAMPSPVERIRTNLDASIASKQQLLADAAGADGLRPRGRHGRRPLPRAAAGSTSPATAAPRPMPSTSPPSSSAGSPATARRCRPKRSPPTARS